jgi:hypothetical protein
MARGQAEPTNVSNATALDDEVIPRLSDAEEWGGAGNQDVRRTFQDHLPAVGHEGRVLPDFRAYLMHGTPFAEDLPEFIGPLCTRSWGDTLHVIGG